MQKTQSASDFLKTSFGNILEWYDFSLYGIFTVSISKAFFPSSSAFLSLLMAFLAFSVSFLARPCGSIIFGYIGDKMGKHYSVNLSIWCMAVPTVLVGFLPTYHQIGVTAPILLILLRIIQGISVGGQFSGLITIAAESHPSNRCYLVSLILAISVIGSLLASAVGLLFYKIFSGFAAESLIWRVPFVLSAALFITYLKLQPEFEKVESRSNFSLREIFKNQPYEILYMILLSALVNAIYYILFSYSVTYLEIHMKASQSSALIAINGMLFLSLICYPIFGKLADKVTHRIAASKKYTLLFAAGIVALSVKPDFKWVVSCLGLMVIAYAAIATHLTSIFAEIFEAKYRMTACSLSYSSGAILGGFSPFTSEVMTKWSSSGFYMFLLTLAFILYLIQDKILETKGYKELNEFNLIPALKGDEP